MSLGDAPVVQCSKKYHTDLDDKIKAQKTTLACYESKQEETNIEELPDDLATLKLKERYSKLTDGKGKAFDHETELENTDSKLDQIENENI